jgi:hypothetical protein
MIQLEQETESKDDKLTSTNKKRKADDIVISPSAEVVIKVKLQPWDVLLGDEIGDHPGNERFRLLVKLHQEEYHYAVRQKQKMEMVETIVKTLATMIPPSRFVESMHHHHGDTSYYYMLASLEDAVHMTQQALRLQPGWLFPTSMTVTLERLLSLNQDLAEQFFHQMDQTMKVLEPMEHLPPYRSTLTAEPTVPGTERMPGSGQIISAAATKPKNALHKLALPQKQSDLSVTDSEVEATEPELNPLRLEEAHCKADPKQPDIIRSTKSGETSNATRNTPSFSEPASMATAPIVALECNLIAHQSFLPCSTDGSKSIPCPPKHLPISNTVAGPHQSVLRCPTDGSTSSIPCTPQHHQNSKTVAGPNQSVLRCWTDSTSLIPCPPLHHPNGKTMAGPNQSVLPCPIDGSTSLMPTRYEVEKSATASKANTSAFVCSSPVFKSTLPTQQFVTPSASKPYRISEPSLEQERCPCCVFRQGLDDSNKAQADEEPTVTSKLRCCDVLLDYGSEANGHPGNERFRLLVKLFGEEYSKLSDRLKLTFAQKFVTNLANMVPPGRFVWLERTNNKYSCVPFDVAVAATVLALQDTIGNPFDRQEALENLVALNFRLAKDYRCLP